MIQLIAAKCETLHAVCVALLVVADAHTDIVHGSMLYVVDKTQNKTHTHTHTQNKANTQSKLARSANVIVEARALALELDANVKLDGLCTVLQYVSCFHTHRIF